MELFFHFFRNYKATIYIKHIGRQVIDEEHISLIFTFTMYFDNKYYTFIGHSSETEYISIARADTFYYILFRKQRDIVCQGIYNNSIQIDLNLSPEEYAMFHSSS